MPSVTHSLTALLATAATVTAHGFVNGIIVNGVAYGGYLMNKYPYTKDPPTVAAWSEQQKDGGFISPNEYTTPDIICHRDAKNAGAHVTVKAGDSIWIQWNGWPDGHVGPVLDYLASCGNDKLCEEVDKNTLKFFKIDEAGLQNGTNKFYSEILSKNSGWMVRIPEKLKAGNYVLRHEIIALHASGKTNGAQNYPQCFNIKVEGSGSVLPDGIFATQFYKPDDLGILVSVYGNFHSYKNPGPGVVDIGGMVEEQSPSSASTSALPTIMSNSTAMVSSTSTAAHAKRTVAEAGSTITTAAQPSQFETRVRSGTVPQTSCTHSHEGY